MHELKCKTWGVFGVASKLWVKPNKVKFDLGNAETYFAYIV